MFTLILLDCSTLPNCLFGVVAFFGNLEEVMCMAGESRLLSLGLPKSLVQVPLFHAFLESMGLLIMGLMFIIYWVITI